MKILTNQPLANYKITGTTPEWLGQVRHIISGIGGALIMTGILQITQGNLADLADKVDVILTQATVIFGLVMQVVAMVSSWFAKEKKDV